MKVGQLKTLVEAFANLSAAICGDSFAFELREFAGVLPASGKLTTIQFVNHLKKNLPQGSGFPSPVSLRTRLEALEAFLASAAPKSANDVKTFLSILEKNHEIKMAEFIQLFKAARDYVPPAKPVKPKTSPRVDATVAGYVDRLKSSAIKSSEFQAVFNSLKLDAGLSDARLKKISKALWGKSAKSRDEALKHILEFQNSEMLSYSSRKALELAPV